MRRGHRARRAAAIALLAAACGGCNEYLVRRDAASPMSGEAVRANAAVHIIDPWSPASRRSGDATDGQRLQQAVERYRNPASGPSLDGAPALPARAPSGSSTAPPALTAR